MKAVVLLTALAFSSVLSATAQQKEKKDDVYPASVPENRERFAPLKSTDSDQETGFKIENYELVWQKVFDTRMQPEQIERYFRRSGIFKQIDAGTNELRGFLSYFNAKGAELSTILTPYTRNTLFAAFAVIDFKTGKYRVTVKKIMIKNYYAEQNVKFSYDDLAFKSNQYEMKPSFLKKEAKVMDEVLTRMFSLNVAGQDNW
ncbi:hypothetical protein [Pedobacter heparinus]|uniref:hypothetical protein n=1 Tax=Pedobacter heparinus TaxID=984 RepID=UPI0029317FA2|nr:hypothetical protein [Pedobacter heparinus]